MFINKMEDPYNQVKEMKAAMRLIDTHLRAIQGVMSIMEAQIERLDVPDCSWGYEPCPNDPNVCVHPHISPDLKKEICDNFGGDNSVLRAGEKGAIIRLPGESAVPLAGSRFNVVERDFPVGYVGDPAAVNSAILGRSLRFPAGEVSSFGVHKKSPEEP